MGGAIGVGVFERVAQLAFVSDRQSFQRQGRTRHITAQPFELIALMGLAANGCIQREAVAGDSQRFDGAGRQLSDYCAS